MTIYPSFLTSGAASVEAGSLPASRPDVQDERKSAIVASDSMVDSMEPQLLSLSGCTQTKMDPVEFNKCEHVQCAILHKIKSLEARVADLEKQITSLQTQLNPPSQLHRTKKRHRELTLQSKT